MYDNINNYPQILELIFVYHSKAWVSEFTIPHRKLDITLLYSLLCYCVLTATFYLLVLVL